jgi:hypothetical protein
MVDIILTGETEDVGERPVPVLLCPPQVQHGLGANPSPVVRGRRLNDCGNWTQDPEDGD